MKFRLDYDAMSGKLDDIALIPSDKESADVLHGYAKKLVVVNPALAFNELVKDGKMNECSDAAYGEAIDRMKHVSFDIFNKEYCMNIFALCTNLMRSVLSGACGYGSSNKALMSVQDFLDSRGILGRQRSSFYRFISKPCIHRMRHNDGTYRELNIDESPIQFFLPKENSTHYILQSNKVLVVTSYDPVNTWCSIDPDPEVDDYLDIREILKDSGVEWDESMIGFLSEDSVVLHSSDAPFDVFKDRVAELYVYDDDIGNESITFKGYLKLRHVTVEGGKEPDFVYAVLSGNPDTDDSVYFT